MDHVAIMKKSWGLIPKILTGEKQIESRWYKNKSRPWGRIDVGDVVYFKNSGEMVTVKAVVSKVLSFGNLTPEMILQILKKYGYLDGINEEGMAYFYEMFKNKKYCLLIFLRNVERIAPFQIDKKGFGAMSAWISTDNIDIIRKLKPAGADG